MKEIIARENRDLEERRERGAKREKREEKG
jgi:hypothetical protein